MSLASTRLINKLNAIERLTASELEVWDCKHCTIKNVKKIKEIGR